MPITSTSDNSTAGGVIVSTDGMTSPTGESVSGQSAVDVYADLRQTPDDVTGDESTGTATGNYTRRVWHRWRPPGDKTASLEVGLGRTGTIRSTGTDMWSELGSSRSSNVTGSDRSRTVDGRRPMSGITREDDVGKDGGETLFRSASVDYEVNATYVVEEGEGVTKQEHQQLLGSDDEDGERRCEVKLRGCPACWIKLQIEVRKRTVNSSRTEANELVDEHDDAKVSLFADSVRGGSVRGDSDKVNVDEDWDDYVPILFNCELW